MGSKATWGAFNGWSGPKVKGTCRWSPPANPDGLDLILASIAEPEGACYDSVYSCDGTGTTWGFLQWTLTSERLQRLLVRVEGRTGTIVFNRVFGFPLIDATKIRIAEDGFPFVDGKPISLKAAIRSVFTPPDGHVPRSGPHWERAAKIAVLFSLLGEIEAAQEAQVEFAEDEIEAAIKPKRPAMGGKRIADWLYPDGWERGSLDELGVIRALFWSFWQNSPRKAEEYLASLKRPVSIGAIARKFGLSRFARWGVHQVKKPSRSRYEKSARVINKMLGDVVVPELWK